MRPHRLPLVALYTVLFTVALLSFAPTALAQPNDTIDSVGVLMRLLGPVYALDVRGDMVWASDGDQLAVFDLTVDPDHAMLGLFPDLGGYALRVNGNRLVVADASDQILRIVDITDPLVPTDLGHLDIDMHGWGGTQLDVANDRAYIANLFGPNQYGVQVVDISDSGNPVVGDPIQSGPTNYTHFAASGDVLVLFDEHQDHLVPVDMSGNEPVFGTPLPLPMGMPADMSADGGVLAVQAAEGVQVALLDMTNPAQLTALGDFTFPALADGSGLSIRGDRLLLAFQDALTNPMVGLLDLSDPSTPIVLEQNLVASTAVTAVVVDDQGRSFFSDGDVDVRISTDPAPGWEQTLDVPNRYTSFHVPRRLGWYQGFLVDEFGTLQQLKFGWPDDNHLVRYQYSVPPGSRGIGMWIEDVDWWDDPAEGWYALGTPDDIRLYHFAWHDSLSFVTSVPIPAGTGVRRKAMFSSDGRYMLIHDGETGVHRVDLTTDTPEITDTWVLENFATIFWPRSDLLIGSWYENDAEEAYTACYQLSNNDDPALLWQDNGYTAGLYLYEPGGVPYLFRSGERIYPSDSESLDMFEFSDPATPEHVASLPCVFGDLNGAAREILILSQEHNTLVRCSFPHAGDPPVIDDMYYLGTSEQPVACTMGDYHEYGSDYFAWSFIRNRALGMYSLGWCSDVDDEDGDHATVPTRITLAPVYPNPFNGSATVRFAVPTSGEVTVKLVNTLGQTVWQLAPSPHTAGSHTLTLPGDGLASGRYVLSVERSRGGRVVQPVTLVK